MRVQLSARDHTAYSPAASAYVVVALIWLVPLGLAVASVVRRPHDATLWGMLAIVSISGIAAIAWLSRHRIRVFADRIRYTTPWREIEIPLGEVESARLVIGADNYRDRFLPPVRIEIWRRVGGARRRVAINAKVFRRRDIDELLDLLSKKIET